MKKHIRLDPSSLVPIRRIDERLVSYNIEMTEVTGGTFWKEYTKAQIEGTQEFAAEADLTDFTAMSGLMQYYPSIDLYNPKLRRYASELGPAWIRVSGTWATKTYYDFEGKTGGTPPKGYQSVLTKEQWIGVLDFVKAVDGKLLISVSNCEGDHPDGGALDLIQTKKIFDLSHEYGVDIAAAEFMNEPNMLEMSGAPKGYTAADYARDQDIFNGWVRESYPDCLIVGPCATGDTSFGVSKDIQGGGIAELMKVCSTDELMNGTTVPLDVFSYHYYNGISERLAGLMPSGHWDSSAAHTDAYLDVVRKCALSYIPLRDKYVPNGQMWVTESGDAGGGGNTWASTYLDVLRTLNELGSFAAVTDGVIFHNTLASSDYGFLKHGSFEPRPNYFAVLLWNKLMGQTVYDCDDPDTSGAHIYCHSLKGDDDRVVFLVINNSLTEYKAVELMHNVQRFTLSTEHHRAEVMQLNNRRLTSSSIDLMPTLEPVYVEAGLTELPPLSCNFFVMRKSTINPSKR